LCHQGTHGQIWQNFEKGRLNRILVGSNLVNFQSELTRSNFDQG